MTSVQLPTKATLSATLLLVLILGSVLCPPCKARQLMLTPEERIEITVCDNLDNFRAVPINKEWITFYIGSNPFTGIDIDAFNNLRASGNLRIKIASAIARFCENKD